MLKNRKRSLLRTVSLMLVGFGAFFSALAVPDNYHMPIAGLTLALALLLFVIFPFRKKRGKITIEQRSLWGESETALAIIIDGTALPPDEWILSAGHIQVDQIRVADTGVSFRCKLFGEGRLKRVIQKKYSWEYLRSLNEQPASGSTS